MRLVIQILWMLKYRICLGIIKSLKIKIMNIKVKKPLFEAEQFQTPQFQQNQKQQIGSVEDETIEIVLKNKSKQFQFDCGVIMARINVNLNNKFGLKYHFEQSASFDSFLTSVENFIKISGNILSSNDINNLQNQFEKANKQKS